MHLKNLDVTKGDIVTNTMEFYPDMLNLRMKDLILRKTGCGIVVAVDGSAPMAGEVEAI